MLRDRGKNTDKSTEYCPNTEQKYFQGSSK